ncbi:MAG: nucleotidyltransferase family protein [Myxococcaceae bacterium]
MGPPGMVEVHFRLMANWGASGVSSTLEGRSVRYLCPEDELVYLALHVANHMLGRLGWLYDLKLLVLAYPSLDWSRVVETAREARMPGPAFYALDASRRLLGAGIPEAVLEELAPSRLKGGRLTAAVLWRSGWSMATWASTRGCGPRPSCSSPTARTWSRSLPCAG